MSSNEIETNNRNGSRLAEQGTSSDRCSRHGNIGHHHANPVISKRRKWAKGFYHELWGNKNVSSANLLQMELIW